MRSFDALALVVQETFATRANEGGAHNFHDANYLTFHRLDRFRQN